MQSAMVCVTVSGVEVWLIRSYIGIYYDERGIDY